MSSTLGESLTTTGIGGIRLDAARDLRGHVRAGRKHLHKVVVHVGTRDVDFDQVGLRFADVAGNDAKVIDGFGKDAGDDGHAERREMLLGLADFFDHHLDAGIGKPDGVDEAIAPIYNDRIVVARARLKRTRLGRDRPAAGLGQSPENLVAQAQHARGEHGRIGQAHAAQARRQIWFYGLGIFFIASFCHSSFVRLSVFHQPLT